MDINLHNYEAFFLDHKEGNLSSQQEKELFLFLEKHPHLYEELNNYEEVVLENFGVEELFTNKNSIKKSDYTNDNLIAYTEGLLDGKNKKEIDILALQNAAFKKELEFYKNTHLQPDLTEKFKNKAKLKRSGLIIALQNNYTFLRVAAAVLLLIGFFFLVAKLNTKEDSNKDKTEVADVAKESRDKKQEAVSSKQLAVSSKDKQDQRSTKQEAVSSNEKQEQRSKKQVSSKQLAVNSVQTNSVLANNAIKNNEKDSVPEKIIVVENNNKQENKNTGESYFNYSADKEDEAPVTASLNTSKKSFFQRVVKVAKKVNDLGVKEINSSEENDSNSLSIGSFVVSETSSN